MKIRSWLCGLVTALFVLFSGSSLLAETTMAISIGGPGQKKVNIYVAKPLLKAEGLKRPVWEGVQTQMFDALSFLPFVQVVAAQEILGGSEPGDYQAEGIDFNKYLTSQVDVLITGAVTPNAGASGRLELRAYEVFSKRLILGRAYSVGEDSQISSISRRFLAELLEALAGKGDFFRSKLAFVQRKGPNKEIWTCTSTGDELRQITTLSGINMSPSWSRDGRLVAFTHLDSSGHRLGLWSSGTKATKLYEMPGNSCIGPVFGPEGRIVVSLDVKGNQDIYQLDRALKLGKPLIENWGIDVSPSFDAKGELMAFVSDRVGNPHIYMLELKTGVVKRLTFDGKYNTSPSLSSDGKSLAFVRLTDSGHRIFVLDLEKNVQTQLTSGPGDDEDPEWSPDGYFLAFASNRSGVYKLYITTRFGDTPKLVPTGGADATSPAWVAAED